MPGKVVSVTGGSGFVGQALIPGLKRRGYRVRVVDRMRGALVTGLRRRYLGTARSAAGLRAARAIHRTQRRLEPALVRRGLIRPTWDDIQDVRSRLAARFADSHAVIHLAGIAHPHAPGVIEEDFRRINLHAAANVLAAARDAGVAKFVFASSAQVYRINSPVRIDQLPIVESNYLPSLDEGQSTYGFLKAEFERHMEAACADGSIQGIALRLEFPGVRSTASHNFYVSTSIENLVAGFASALEAPDTFAFEAFNLADPEVDPSIVDVQEFVRTRWPQVPNHTRGNESLLSIEKATRILGYEPAAAATYYDESVMW